MNINWDRIRDIINLYNKDSATLAFYDNIHEYAIAGMCIYANHKFCISMEQISYAENMIKTMTVKLLLCNEYDDNVNNVITIQL